MLQYNFELLIIKQDIGKLLDSKKCSVTENMTKKLLIELDLERGQVSEKSVQMLHITVAAEIFLLKLYNNN